jgi:hypothetical protein
MRNKHLLVLVVNMGVANGCWESSEPPALKVEVADGVEPKVRTEPDWSGGDMQVWRFAKDRGVHANDFMKRNIGSYELMFVRDLPEEIPPMHAGPTSTPELWVVRDGETLFTFDDARMASVLMTDEALALAKLFADDLSWMGADEIHALAQAQDHGVTTLSWTHNKQTYPSNSDTWERIVVTASQEGTKFHSEPLKDYVRAEQGSGTAMPTKVILQPQSVIPKGHGLRIDNETGERQVIPAASLPDSIRWVTKGSERIEVARIEMNVMGSGREIKRFDKDGMLLDVTTSRQSTAR